MPTFQYKLRTLLVLTFAVGCGLGWWFRPYAIEAHWPDGRLRSQMQVRRQMNGEVITNGQQSWWWRNGQLARQGNSYGHRVLLPQRSFAVLTIPLKQETMFTREGEPMTATNANFRSWLRDEAVERTHTDLPALPTADQFAETPHE